MSILIEIYVLLWALICIFLFHWPYYKIYKNVIKLNKNEHK